jgi:hypothetical protein
MRCYFGNLNCLKLFTRMKNFLEKNMVWVTMILMIVLSLFQVYYTLTSTWTLNRTIGWGWSYYDYNYLMDITATCLFYSIPLFTFGYGVLYFLKRRTVFVFSILHLFLILLIAFYTSFHLLFSIFLLNLSWLVFSLNIYKSKKIEI